MIAYPRRGIALLDVRERRDRIPYALLTTPDRLGRMLNGMEDRAPRIEDIRDEFDRMSREVEIGTVTISLTKKDLEPRGGGSRFEDDYRFRARRDIDRGDIRYGAGNAGSVYISVSIYFRDGRDDNHVEVSAQLNGKNERGQVSAFGSGKRDLDRSENRAYRDVDSAISRAYQDAIDDMLDQADRNIRGQKPPSPADYRKLAWIHLFDGPTK